MENKLRLTANDAQAIRDDFQKNKRMEHILFMLADNLDTGNESTILKVTDVIIPDVEDYASQSGAFVSPSRKLELYAYHKANTESRPVLDVHTHPFSQKPTFSAIDMEAAYNEAAYIMEKDLNLDYGLIVSNPEFTSFSGLILNKESGDFERIDSIEILGSPTELLCDDLSGIMYEDIFSRHHRIPGWDQDLLSHIKVCVVGAGGNGSHIIQALACMGVGKGRGHIMIVDPDVIEESNLSRIPYATKADIGRPKVEVVADYIRAKNPDINVIAIHGSIEDEEIQKLCIESHFIFGNVDMENPRIAMAKTAHKGLIPYLDLASEIIPDENFSGAQTRMFMPHEGCIFCISGINASEAALESLSEEVEEAHRAVGYVRGTGQSPIPSVIHLNGVIAFIGISIFTKVIFGDFTNNQKAIIYDQGEMSLLTASFNRNKNCPLCGDKPSEEEIEASLEELRKNIRKNLAEADKEDTLKIPEIRV